MDELRNMLRPLVDTPPAEPPPVEEIAARAGHRRQRRRMRLAAAAGVTGLLAVVVVGGSLSSPDPGTETVVGDAPATTGDGQVTDGVSDADEPGPDRPPSSSPSPESTAVPHDPEENGGLPEVGTDPALSVPETPTGEGGDPIIAVPIGREMGDGDQIALPGLDLGAGLATAVEVDLVPAAGTPGGGRLDVRRDAVDSPPIATLEMPTDGEGEQITVSAPTVAAIGGQQNIYLTFSAPGRQITVTVEAFRFVP